MTLRGHNVAGWFIGLSLLLVPGAARPQETPTTRAGIWQQERLEKALSLQPPSPTRAEVLLLGLETSVEQGPLGDVVLGLPVYGWLLLATGMCTLAAAFTLAVVLVRQRRKRRREW